MRPAPRRRRPPTAPTTNRTFTPGRPTRVNHSTAARWCEATSASVQIETRAADSGRGVTRARTTAAVLQSRRAVGGDGWAFHRHHREAGPASTSATRAPNTTRAARAAFRCRGRTGRRKHAPAIRRRALHAAAAARLNADDWRPAVTDAAGATLTALSSSGAIATTATAHVRAPKRDPGAVPHHHQPHRRMPPGATSTPEASKATAAAGASVERYARVRRHGDTTAGLARARTRVGTAGHGRARRDAILAVFAVEALCPTAGLEARRTEDASRRSVTRAAISTRQTTLTVRRIIAAVSRRARHCGARRR